MKICTLIAVLEEFAPLSLAEEYDRVGLMVGDADAECTGVVLALDLTDKVIDEAIAAGANFIVTHHPFIWDPLKNIDFESGKGAQIKRLILHGIAVYSAHTNLDKAPEGMNVYAAQLFGGTNICCDSEGVGAVFETDCTLKELAKRVATSLADGTVRYVGDPDMRIHKAYVVTGSGGSEYDRAKEVAQVLITGELRHHQYIAAENEGFGLIEFSHYYSEIIMQDILCRLIEGTGVKIIKAAAGCPFRRIETL